MVESGLTELIQSICGTSITDSGVLTRATTHRSWAVENNFNGDYERLEFLGDTILAMVVVNYIFQRFPEAGEDYLSRLKSHLVSRQTILRWARKIQLANFIRLGSAEECSGGRTKPSIIVDTFEAVIGALYLQGGLDLARKFIEYFLSQENFSLINDPKSRLQELAQARFNCLPVYNLLSAEGPEHQKTFRVEVKIDDKIFGVGQGNTKKEAEKSAAQDALNKVKQT